MATFALYLSVSPGRAEQASAVLMELGAGAVEERSHPETTELVVYCAERRELETLEQRLSPTLRDDPRHASRIEELDDSWQTAWADGLAAVEVAEGWWVEPVAAAGSAPPDARVLRIEPALAFGVGSHETTRLCAQALLDCLAGTSDLPTRVLDVGCGSGVLALLAAASGVSDVLGVDIDPRSVEAARKNRELNVGWAPRVSAARFSETPVAHLDEPHELVLANLELPTQIELARDLARLTRGQLILSGVLDGAESKLLAIHLELGGRLISRRVLGEWLCLWLEYPSA